MVFFDERILDWQNADRSVDVTEVDFDERVLDWLAMNADVDNGCRPMSPIEVAYR